MAVPTNKESTIFSKLKAHARRTDANTIAAVPLTTKGVLGQTGDLFQAVDSTGAVVSRVGPTPQAFGSGLQLQMARAKFDVAVDGGAISTITPVTNAVIPANAIIVSGFANSTTAMVGVSGTLAIGTSAGSSATSLKAATAITSFSVDAIVALVPVMTAATAFKMSAAGSITVTIATTIQTAGVVEITVFYYVAAAA
jgi:hypothetical protein